VSKLGRLDITIRQGAHSFSDLNLDKSDPDHSEDESRLVTVGYSVQGRLLVVCHVERGAATRLISARRATAREGKRHEN
jgi:uncharacterized DUF497 family protein